MVNSEFIVDIDNLLNKSYIFYAHKKAESDESNGYETIQEHTDRCIDHFRAIVKARNLEAIFLNFKNFLFHNKDRRFWQLFDEMFINTITFHDIGKINPLFQRHKMQNPLFYNEHGNISLGSDHSIISAILYLEYFLPKSMDFPNDIRKKFRFLTFLNAYIISKHHGSLDRFDNFLNAFYESDSNYRYFVKIIREEYQKYFNINFFLENKNCANYVNSAMKYETSCHEESIALYAYERLIYSLLVASDYYATSEFNNNKKIIDFHGNLKDINKIQIMFNNTNINKSIEEYRKTKYYQTEKKLEETKDINVLRNELYLDAETELLKHLDENLLYLEAPTGSGKSNVAFNLSFHLIEHCKDINKIMYIYPFNTLVEQNLKSIENIFGNNKDIMSIISVVNSVTPLIKENDSNYNYEEYEKALLDRQFFNYPISLSTHVTLFDLLFGINKESGFAFYQICNSVIVLDEIQSYKNTIWTEIITFLKVFSKILNLKVIIMSATLPNLDLLTINHNKAVKLISDREKYFLHPLFKDRVVLDFELLNIPDVFQELYRRICHFLECGKRILVEFITKKSAINFYRYFIENITDDKFKIELMTGDDSTAERERIISEIEKIKEGQAFLLISTQVLEAGIDLENMDIGFKDISKLDSEEQFLGRINRSNKKEGLVYFFNYDNAKIIYKDDVRLSDELTLKSEDMRLILMEKNFDSYYRKVLEIIRSQNDSLAMEKNINEFLLQVMKLNAPLISNRMKLIDDDEWCCTVFMNRKLTLTNDEILNGEEIWNDYKQLMINKNDYGYAEWRIKLSIVKSKMTYFTYQINKCSSFPYTDQLGEIFYIHDAEQYFEGNKFIREKLENQVGIII